MIVLQGQKAASAFASSGDELLNAGMFFSIPFKWLSSKTYDGALESVRGDSTYEEERTSLRVQFGRSVAARADLLHIGERPREKELVTWHVQSHALVAISELFSSKTMPCSFTPLPVSMDHLGLADGLSSKGSTMDMAIESRDIIRGVVEAKGTEASAEEGLRQAFAYGTNIALGLRRKGVAAADVCVPVVAITGRLVQFGCVLMLEPAFPSLVITSRCLDAMDPDDCALVVDHFLAIQRIASAPLAVTEKADASLVLCLGTNPYHIKPLGDFFPVLGRELHNFNASLARFGRIMERLVDCASSVCLPLTILHPYKDTKQNSVVDGIVFPMLSGYRIGLPSDLELSRRIVQEARKVMDAVHERGVVHMDLYPSNIMWKAGDGPQVHIKIIDWDAAHLLHEQFSAAVQQRLEKFAPARLKGFSHAGVASREFDSFYLDVLEFAVDDEGRRQALVTDQKLDLDQNFPKLCAEFVEAQALTHQMSSVSTVEEPIEK